MKVVATFTLNLGRRIARPFVEQLTQGLSPERLALTLALGTALATVPVVGTTTLLCGAAAWALRLNQPVIQLVNFCAYPLQLALLIPFIRLGEWLFRAPRLPLSLTELLTRMSGDFFGTLFSLAATSGRAVVAWLLVSIPVGLAHYVVARGVLRFVARRLAARAAAAAAVTVEDEAAEARLVG